MFHLGCQQYQTLQLTPAADAVKKDFSSSTVESDVFIEELSQDQRWYTLGILLGVPTHKLDTISINYFSSGIRRCLGELYKCCMELEGGVSWEQIVEALRKMDNGFLAGIIHSKHISPSPLSESEDSGQNRTKQVEVPDEVVKTFNKLSVRFNMLHQSIRQSIRQSQIHLDDLQELIRVECLLEPLSSRDATVDNVLKRLSQHYCLLNVRILQILVETLLIEEYPLQSQLTEYIELLDEFKSSAEMKHLVYLLKQQQTVNSGHKLVKLCVREFWSDLTLKKFEKVLRAILKTEYSYTSQITVELGGSDTAAVTSSSSSSEGELVPVVSTHSQSIQEPLNTQPGHHSSEDILMRKEPFKNTGMSVTLKIDNMYMYVYLHVQYMCTLYMWFSFI